MIERLGEFRWELVAASHVVDLIAHAYQQVDDLRTHRKGDKHEKA
jgi:hypothetical protein